MPSPDVLVVGLGPAGASAAAAAAAGGCRVLALERRHEFGAPVQCAEFVSAMLSLEELRAEALTEQPIRRMLTQVEQSAPESLEDFRGRIISRAAFDAALVRSAERAGAMCRGGTTVAAVGSDGSARLADGSLVRPRVIIGADGPRSRIGAAIGCMNREFVATRQISVRLLQSHDATDIFLRAAFRGGYGWLFPKRGIANLGIGVAYRERHRLPELVAQLRDELVDCGRIALNETDQMTGGLIPVGGRIRASGWLGKVPVLLAGDAAGLTNPVTGAGIEAAVASGQQAGAAAASYLAGAAGGLEQFEEELAELFDPAQARALRRRRELQAAGERPSGSVLRRTWIASPDYWRH